MSPDLVVVGTPLQPEISGVPEALEAMLVQQFITDTPVEALGVWVLGRLAGPDEVMFDPIPVGPCV